MQYVSHSHALFEILSITVIALNFVNTVKYDNFKNKKKRITKA